MAKEYAALLLTLLLLVTTKVSSDRQEEEETFRQATYVGSPALAPVPAPAIPPPPHKIVDPKDCLGACNERCSLHSRKNVCGRACMTCCNTCKCVPAGTSGNRETCGNCYTGWTTHGNRTKCP